MIGLSQTTGYAIQALSCLNDPECCCRSIADIAKCSTVPRPYLAKIFNALVRAGIVKAKRGVGGGISLVREPREITLLSIVVAIEGAHWISDCLIGLGDCSDGRPCVSREFWQAERRRIETYLQKTSLGDVIAFHERFRKRPAKPRKTSTCCSS